ncbi:MBL fold metallo-hydrolase [Sphingomonas sp.]|jgi:glyoxylase-like metal-dependent hydrolase (beta-lactamase superfamily II)|uniref:MBL fold metallo-hydrolase n=1 Tax=Sphingomonas sp. TaxID=28214 RepID=UPI002D7F4071|nr:MBL fold metallo-hydrolase [Sphingomonas sp.]HEU0045152.1 MBL fold metallo-hydrolase [Sphingomonas sp.]
MTSSRADPATPDVSLTDPDEASGQAYTHKGLTYPLGRRAPGEGEIIALADGVGWARLPIPGSLRHINIWVLEDGEGVALVDTGLDIPACRSAWEALIDGPLAGRSVTRVICTHFHPDHIGLAGWLTGRFAVPLWMTRGEWLFGRLLASDVREAPPAEAIAYWRSAGWEESRIEAEAAKGWGRFASVVSPIPVGFVRIQDGDRLRIGEREWRILVGSGHCPEHACLIDDSAGLMIAGDQVLPRITSNVSLSLSEPQADPLGEWLASIDKLKGLPDSLLVLPSHGEPFTGLHARLDALDFGHRDRLDALHAKLSEPRRAVDCFGTLFARQIEDGMLGLATGEALAHLRRLEVEGRAVREAKDGVHWYRAA